MLKLKCCCRTGSDETEGNTNFSPNCNKMPKALFPHLHPLKTRKSLDLTSRATSRLPGEKSAAYITCPFVCEWNCSEHGKHCGHARAADVCASESAAPICQRIPGESARHINIFPPGAKTSGLTCRCSRFL